MRIGALLLTLLGLLMPLTGSATNTHTRAIPLDTLLFYQSRNEQLISRVSPLTGFATLEALIETQEMDHPGADFLLQLLTQGSGILARGSAATAAELGIDPTGWLSLYQIGITPLLRVDLSQPDRLRHWLEEQAGQAGYPLIAQMMDQAQWYRMQLDNSTAQSSWQLHLWIGQESLTLALAPAEMPDADLLPRLSGQALDDADALTGRVQATAARYGLGEQLGWFDLEVLAGTLIGQQRNLLARELQHYAPTEKASLGLLRSEVCEAEWMALIGQSPRLVFGQHLDLNSGPSMDDTSHLIWELTNPELKSQLQLLQGRLPTDLTQLDRTRFSLGLGFNTEQLVPLLIRWWQATAEQPWQCPQLVQLQSVLSMHNPALFSVAVAMLQGTESLVIDLFDLGVDPFAAPEQMDLLLAIRSRNPSMLATLLSQFLTLGRSQPVLPDGEPVTLLLPVEGWALQARIVADYLLLYQGEQAEARASRLPEIEHEPGFIAASLDISSAIERLTPLLALTPLLDHEYNGLCLDLEEMLDGAARYSALSTSLQLQGSEQGLSARQRLRGERRALPSPLVSAGHYDVALLDSDCVWQDHGQETLGTDGVAVLYRMDEDSSGRCRVYEARSNWRLEGNRLRLSQGASRLRYGCDTGFSSWEGLADSDCHLLRVDDGGGFDCIVFDQEWIRLRYTPAPP